MAYSVTHVILTIVILDLFRHYVFGKLKFPRYWLLIGGIAGLVPDLDIPFSWIYNFFTGLAVDFHGTFTHSLIFPLIFLVLGGILYYKKNSKWAGICFVISAGWFLHLILDCGFGDPKEFIWPFFINNFCPQWGIQPYAMHLDAIILVLWLVHEEVHKKIKDYI